MKTTLREMRKYIKWEFERFTGKKTFQIPDEQYSRAVIKFVTYYTSTHNASLELTFVMAAIINWKRLSTCTELQLYLQ